MKAKIINLCQHVFGITITISVLVGAVVAALLVVAFIMGGASGQSLALLSKNIMYKAITLSAIGSVVGMLAFYIDNSHMLTMGKTNGQEEDE